ncbi:unnamed protein product [Nesidiocoris tenuis]|uniref:Uncharacterized protein n=1 Tax=Nesidiocoris tenuis TaxID=355587 RepID=A0A6H5GN24_9HEMI|nr:unnamed protein product [Nesidiocoris tenuis]CAB0004462.1 unnamed protein product [Nesidiocoris tenuis]
MDEVNRAGSTRRVRLGRKLSRRLSLVARVPNLIGVRLRQEFGSSSSLSNPSTKTFHLTVIAPDKSQRIPSLLHQSESCFSSSIAMSFFKVSCATFLSRKAVKRGQTSVGADVMMTALDARVHGSGTCGSGFARSEKPSRKSGRWCRFAE